MGDGLLSMPSIDCSGESKICCSNRFEGGMQFHMSSSRLIEGLVVFQTKILTRTETDETS